MVSCIDRRLMLSNREVLVFFLGDAFNGSGKVFSLLPLQRSVFVDYRG